MGRYIVMDVVFYGNSLNYDQGSGNYQELKKITKWDGKQYTLVSRYALRYSILETAKKVGLWDVADGSKLQRAGEGEQTVIQPAEEILLSGEILKYPEFDLFGYLITSTTPQNFREAPVKISHAVSLTPFAYDALFNANIGLANRMRKATGGMDPNPFTAEEHETYYQYSVVVDIEKIGKIEIYLAKTIKEGNKQRTMNSVEIKKDDKGNIDFKINYSRKNEPLKFKHREDVNKNIYISKLILPFKENDNNVKFSEELKEYIEFNDNVGAMIIEYRLIDEKIKERVKELIKAIFNLKRSIKGRDEDLSPKLMVIGLYKDAPYRTFKDKITLVDEYVSEEYDEIEEDEKDGKKVYRVRHRITKSRKPVFEIEDGNLSGPRPLNENDVLNLIENELFNAKQKKNVEKVEIFHDSSVTVKLPKHKDE